MATEAPYKLSRAALRERFGARRIDGSAPQSNRDTTPSGVAARQEQAGLSAVEAGTEDAKAWSRAFPTSPWATRRLDAVGQAPVRTDPFTPYERATQADVGITTRPMDLIRRRMPAQSPLDSIRQMEEATGALTAPARPSLMPSTPVADVSNYLTPLGGSRIASLFPSLRPKKPAPSILDGAESWLRTV